MRPRAIKGRRRRDEGEDTGATVAVDVVASRAYSVATFCAAAEISPATLRRFQHEGVLASPSGPAARRRYDDAALARVRTARRLMRDLGVNASGAAVALRLLDELTELRAELTAALARLAAIEHEMG